MNNTFIHSNFKEQKKSKIKFACVALKRSTKCIFQNELNIIERKFTLSYLKTNNKDILKNINIGASYRILKYKYSFQSFFF